MLGLASLGIGAVTVCVGACGWPLLTGEIPSPASRQRPGAVHDSNRPTTCGQLAAWAWRSPTGAVRDEPQALKRSFHTAAAQTGRRGDHQRWRERRRCRPHARRCSGRRAHGGVAFWRIAMRPTPDGVGDIWPAPMAASAVLFGLPGNPVAAMVTFPGPSCGPHCCGMMGPPGVRPGCCAPAARRRLAQEAWAHRVPARTVETVDGRRLSRCDQAQGLGACELHGEANGSDRAATTTRAMSPPATKRRGHPGRRDESPGGTAGRSIVGEAPGYIPGVLATSTRSRCASVVTGRVTGPRVFFGARRMALRASSVVGRHHEDRPQVPSDMPPDDDPADLAAARRPAPRPAPGIAPSTMAPVVIMIGRSRCEADSLMASSVFQPARATGWRTPPIRIPVLA